MSGPSSPPTNQTPIGWSSSQPDPDGKATKRDFPLPRSLANVKRGFSEKKWTDSKNWTREKPARASNRKYRPGGFQKPVPTVAKARKRLAAFFYQLKMGHCLTGQYLAWTARRLDATSWWCQYHTQTRDHLFKHCPEWENQQRTLWNTVSTETRKLPGPTRERHKTSIAELSADQRCSQAVLDFLENTDVGRTSGPPVAEEADEEASEVSGWEEREREERLAEMRAEAERLGGRSRRGCFSFSFCHHSTGSKGAKGG